MSDDINRRKVVTDRYRKQLARKAKFHAFVRSNYLIWVSLSFVAFIVVVPVSCAAQISIDFYKRAKESASEFIHCWIYDVRDSYASFVSCMGLLWQERGKLTPSGYKAMMIEYNKSKETEK